MQIAIQNYIVLVLATVIPRGFTLNNTIKCFQCNSAEYPECTDIQANDTNSPFLKPCIGSYGDKEPFCRKVVTNVLDSEEERVIRTCGWILDKNVLRKDICRKRDTDFILKKTCVCFSDMCNSSTNIHVSFWLLPVFLVLCLLKYNNFS